MHEASGALMLSVQFVWGYQEEVKSVFKLGTLQTMVKSYLLPFWKSAAIHSLNSDSIFCGKTMKFESEPKHDQIMLSKYIIIKTKDIKPIKIVCFNQIIAL